MSGERLERVKAFSELSAGMLVVVGCNGCGGQHRGMLLPGGTVVCRQAPAIPMEPCLSACGRTAEVCGCAIERGAVYRVIDPDLESSDEYHRQLSADEDLAKVRAHQRTKERAK